MPENQKKTPCSKLPKRNPDSKPNSDTTPTSDGQTQRPEMADNGREIEFSELNSDTTPASDGQIQRPEMADNGREIEFSELNSDTTPASDGQTQRPEMADNGREIEFSELPFRQQAALPGIAHARSLAQAARDTGVAERTLRRWLEDPSFRQELDRLRQESYDLARQQAQAAMPMCLSILADAALESPDPALRLRAARYLLSYGVKFVEADSLKERLNAVEDAFHSAKPPLPCDSPIPARSLSPRRGSMTAPDFENYGK